MVQFGPGSSHSAKVVMTNPTSGAFDYSAILYMGVNKATMAEVSFHLNAGESKEVTFTVVMPTTAGEYPVYISVFSGGALLGHYQSTENVTITAPAPPAPFTFSNLSVQRVRCESATAWNTLNFSCTITNPASVSITHTLTPMYRTESKYGYGDPRSYPSLYTFTLTLKPGQSYNRSIKGSYYDAEDRRWRCAMIIGFSSGVPYGGCAFLRDENGNDSPQRCV